MMDFYILSKKNERWIKRYGIMIKIQQVQQKPNVSTFTHIYYNVCYKHYLCPNLSRYKTFVYR